MVSTRRLWLLAVVVAGGASGAGCATINYAPRIVSVGTGEYQSTQGLDQKAAKVTAAEAARVKVYFDDLPDGMTSQNGKLVWDPTRYEIVGRVGVTPLSAGFSNVAWGFYDYAPDQSWRKGYCWWQVPLGWLTIGIWAITPFYAACWVLPESDPAVRKDRIVQSVRRAGYALGADLVVMGTTNLFGQGPMLIGAHGGTAFRFKAPGSLPPLPPLPAAPAPHTP